MHFRVIPDMITYNEKGSTRVLIELNRKLRQNPMNAL